jgi:hypothetical protein
VTTFQANSEGITPDKVIDHLIAKTPIDVLDLAKYVRFVARAARGQATASGEMPFDVVTHPDAQSKVAIDMIDRIRADVGLYAQQYNQASKAEIVCIAFNAGSSMLACTSDKGTVHIFKLNDRVASDGGAGGALSGGTYAGSGGPAGGEGDLVAGAGIGRPPVRVGGLELDGAGEAELPEGPYVRVARERGLHLLAEELGAGGDLTGGEQGLQFAKRGAGDRTAERVAREGVAVEEGPLFRELADERGVDLLRRQRGRERQVAGGEPFREAEEIRDDAVNLGDGERTDPPEASEDLIEDEVHAMGAAEVGDGFHEARGLLDHPRGTLHPRLEDQAGRGGAVALQEALQRGQRGSGVRALDLAGTFGVDRGRESLRGEEPRIEAAVELGALADGHRPKGIAMVGAFHRDHPAFGGLADELPVLERELQGHLHGVAAVVGEEAAGERAAGEPGEVLGQLGRDRVVEPEEGDVRDLLGLLA